MVPLKIDVTASIRETPLRLCNVIFPPQGIQTASNNVIIKLVLSSATLYDWKLEFIWSHFITVTCRCNQSVIITYQHFAPFVID